MALTDFLTEGAQIPEGSALKATTSQTILPEWYTNYATQVLANQQGLGTQAYTPYQGPRVAGFTQPQQQGFQMTGQAATAYQPGLNAGMNAVNSAINTAQGGSGQAMSALGSLSGGGGGAAAARPYFDAAGNLANQGTQNSGLSIAQPTFQRAEALDAVGAAQPALGQASAFANQGTQNSGLSVAQPYLSTAAGNAANVSEYMNPYTDSVVSRIADLGTRNLTENLLPQIEGRYIGAGQWNGTGKMTDTARAIRDVSADVLAQQNSALNQGYTQAQAAKQADLARQAQLGATAGSLGTQQQNTLLQAAGLQSQIGGQQGQLTQAQQNALTDIANAKGNLGVAQQDALFKAAGIQSGLGSSLGNLAQGDQQIALNAALGLGNLSNNTASTLGSLGSTAAGLGGLAQQYGLTGAGALGDIGKQQQGLNQQNLDVAYSDFLRQQGYPQSQIDAMLGTFKGVATGIPTAAQEFGIVPNNDQTYQPSTASTIASALAGAGGLISSLKGL